MIIVCDVICMKLSIFSWLEIILHYGKYNIQHIASVTVCRRDMDGQTDSLELLRREIKRWMDGQLNWISFIPYISYACIAFSSLKDGH